MLRAPWKAGGRIEGGQQYDEGKVFTDDKTKAFPQQSLSPVAMQGLVWLVWDSAVRQAVESSVLKDS